MKAGGGFVDRGRAWASGPAEASAQRTPRAACCHDGGSGTPLPYHFLVRGSRPGRDPREVPL